MRLRTGWGAVACAAVLGCGAPTVEKLGEKWGGVYAVESFTTNATGCDGEGASTLESLRERHVVVVATKTLGESRVGVLSCADLEACREKARQLAAGEMLSGEYFYDFTTVTPGGGLSARYASSGFASEDRKLCTGGSASDRTLTRVGDRLRIEERTRRASDYPADAEGGCWTDKALAAAEGKPCGQLRVLTATAVR